MYGLPLFDIADAKAVMAEIKRARSRASRHYIKVNAYDARLGRQTTALSFIVQRPEHEPGFRLDRREAADRQIRYQIHAYAADEPHGERYETAADDAARSRRGLSQFAGRRHPGAAGSRADRPRPRQDAHPGDRAPAADRQAARPGRLGTGERPPLHMSFTGKPGTGKTTVASRMAEILHRLGYLRKGHLVVATRDDLVGQYIGHTAPKTKEMLKKAMGGVLFIDEAYYLYKPENERDYGGEAIEILLQVMENQRDDLTVIFAGYKDRMDTFFSSNPGLHSRVAHHIDFPDYSAASSCKSPLDARA